MSLRRLSMSCAVMPGSDLIRRAPLPVGAGPRQNRTMQYGSHLCIGLACWILNPDPATVPHLRGHVNEHKMRKAGRRAVLKLRQQVGGRLNVLRTPPLREMT